MAGPEAFNLPAWQRRARRAQSGGAHLLAHPDIARLEVAAAIVAHCRLPAWDAGEHASRSAPSSIGFSFTRQACVVEHGGRARARLVEAASVLVTGPEPADWLRVGEPSEVVEVSASAALRRSVADELSVADADLGDLAHPGDPVAWAVAAELRACARGRRVAQAEALDALVRRLYGHVLLTRFGGRLRAKGDGALDARRLARVAEYVEAHLGEALDLGTLADVAALSPFHFQRSFRRATGSTPHRYVALRRAERAQRQVAQGRHPAQVARSLGYGTATRLRSALQAGA